MRSARRIAARITSAARSRSPKAGARTLAAEVTPDYLREHFANGSNFNLGVVVRGPFVHVDLDSKPDAGESVRTWLSSQPQLATIPRERTGGGAHLVFVCRDLPEDVAKAKKAITAQVNATVTAEFYADGMNLVRQPLGSQKRRALRVGRDGRDSRGELGADPAMVRIRGTGGSEAWASAKRKAVVGALQRSTPHARRGGAVPRGRSARRLHRPGCRQVVGALSVGKRSLRRERRQRWRYRHRHLPRRIG